LGEKPLTISPDIVLYRHTNKEDKQKQREI